MRAQTLTISHPPLLSRAVAIAGHLALWPALYAAAVLCSFFQLAGLWRGSVADFIAIGCVFCTALGTYLIDRVKIAPALMDPADRIAHPARYQFLRENHHVARSLAVVALLGGAFFASQLSRWAPLLVLGSAIGAAIYAPIPKTNRPRLKDILLVKNLYTTAGLIVLAALISFITFLPGYRPVAWEHLAEAPATIAAAILLGLRVLIDAILCDIDDEEADRVSRTQTTVTRFGKSRVQQTSLILQLLLAITLAFAFPLAPMARQLWSVSLIATTLLLTRLKPTLQKDFVDLRLPLEAMAITLILTLH